MSTPMYRTAAVALIIGAALPAGTVVAHADEASYTNCVDATLQHLGYGTPASLGSWVDLGRTIDVNVHQNGTSPQSQVSMVENKGWDNTVAGGIVQCALVNSPI
jgi:hypothetical protein